MIDFMPLRERLLDLRRRALVVLAERSKDEITDTGLLVLEKGERKTEAFLYVLKSRLDELSYPYRLALDYDLKEGRFKSADYKMGYE